MGMRIVACSAVLAVCGLLFLARSARADGKLDRARDDIHDSDDDSDEDSDEDDDDDDGSWVGDLVVGFFDALFSGGDEDDHDHDHDYDRDYDYDYDGEPDWPDFAYSSYPYRHRRAHYVLTVDRELAYAPSATRSDVEPSFVTPVQGQPFAGQLALEGGHWDGLTRTGMSARLLTPTPAELDVRAQWLHEPASTLADALIGDAHISARFAQTGALLLRAGLGVRFWSDAELDALGVDALLGMDLFPVRPLVVSAQVGGGNLGHAPVGNARLQLGVVFRRFELNAGWEWLRIGDTDMSSPVLGMRIWL